MADPTQTLRRELLDDVAVWPDLAAVQAAVDAFRAEYNTNRPHQSLDMAFPAGRFVPRQADERMPLRLPPALAAAAVSQAQPVPGVRHAPEPVATGLAVPPLALSTNGIDPVNLAVEVTRLVPASGNLAVCGQQFWLGPDRADTAVTLWADTAVVHVLINGARLKTVPSRPSPTCNSCLPTVAALPACHRSLPASLVTRLRLTGWSTATA